MGKYYIAIYTHKVKQYCDQQFFRALGIATKDIDCIIDIVDNTQDFIYTERLKKHMINWLGHNKFIVNHLSVEQSPKETLFLRSVCANVNFLRSRFLNTNYEYFVIFETDVIIPKNTFELFEKVKDEADIIGGIYYDGFHNPILWNPHVTCLVDSKHVLSGCTLYSRKLIESIPFRWDPDDTAEFPDSNISVDALKSGYVLKNYAAIKCDHIEKPFGGRGMNEI